MLKSLNLSVLTGFELHPPSVAKNIIVKITANSTNNYKHMHEVKVFQKNKTIIQSEEGLKVIVNSNNKIKKVSADKAAKSLFDSIKRKLNYSELKLSAFQNTLFTTAEGKAEMKDFSSSTDEGEENRYRLAELVSRVARKKRLQADLASGNRAAEDYVMNMAYITGANSRNMTQLISDDEGRVLAVKHNEILNYINQSSDRTIEYAQDGTTIVISGGGSTVYLKQERTDGGGNTSKTRTYLEVPRLTLEQFAVDKDFSPSRRTTEDIRKLFIQGQIKLLEDLLSQTNDNPLL